MSIHDEFPGFAVRHCGNVVVHHGEPPASNPYRGDGRNTWPLTRNDPYTHVDGDERVEALHVFNTGNPPAGLTYWWAPAQGGAYRLDPAVHRIYGLRAREEAPTNG